MSMKVSDMTVDELRDVIGSVVEEKLMVLIETCRSRILR